MGSNCSSESEQFFIQICSIRITRTKPTKLTFSSGQDVLTHIIRWPDKSLLLTVSQLIVKLLWDHASKRWNLENHNQSPNRVHMKRKELQQFANPTMKIISFPDVLPSADTPQLILIFVRVGQLFFRLIHNKNTSFLGPATKPTLVKTGFDKILGKTYSY